MNGVALCVLYIGISGSLKGEDTLATIICIAVGGLIGELIDIDKWLNKLGNFLESKCNKGQKKVVYLFHKDLYQLVYYFV